MTIPEILAKRINAEEITLEEAVERLCRLSSLPRRAALRLMARAL